MPIVASSFRPAWFARGGHAQTLWAALLRRHIPLETRRERLELPDGDFVDLDWHGPHGSGRIVLLLHGLQGSIHSPYIRGMMRALAGAGIRCVLMHFRGCSGESNRLPRGYHSGDTADLSFLVERLGERERSARIAAIGYSLGGNVLLKWMGETGRENPLDVAAAVSVPFELGLCADHIGCGRSRIYQTHLLRSLRRYALQKVSGGAGCSPIEPRQIARLRTIRDFDQQITAPLHGFVGADDYYHQSSCRQYLARITVPTLILQARDDPFMPTGVIPGERELSSAVILEVSECGGHVGFVAGNNPLSPVYWLENRLPRFVSSMLGRARPG